VTSPSFEFNFYSVGNSCLTLEQYRTHTLTVAKGEISNTCSAKDISIGTADDQVMLTCQPIHLTVLNTRSMYELLDKSIA
jgi:hypothetical protein